MISAITIPLVIDYDVTQGSKAFAAQLTHNGYVTMQVIAKNLAGTLNGTIQGQQAIHVDGVDSYKDISSFTINLSSANMSDLIEKTTPLVCSHFAANLDIGGLTGGTVSIYLRILPIVLSSI